MMKKVAFTLMLVFSATAANAGVINLLKKNSATTNTTPTVPAPAVETSQPQLPLVLIPPAPQAQAPVVQPTVAVLKKFAIAKLGNTPAPVPTPEPKTQAPIPEQFFVIFTEETKQIINDIVNCVDGPNGGGHDNVSAVPVPASLPLMATALGIFGITRRRKAFK